eukprot:1770598-Pyramimonas_sp.AAC.1
MAFGAELCVEQTSSRGVFTSEGVTWTGLCIFMAFASMFAIMATLLLQSISRRNAISDRKMTELSALIRSSATRMATMAARNGESTEWLNLLLQNAWCLCRGEVKSPTGKWGGFPIPWSEHVLNRTCYLGYGMLRCLARWAVRQSRKQVKAHLGNKAGLHD